jgi:hypothetical protein
MSTARLTQEEGGSEMRLGVLIFLSALLILFGFVLSEHLVQRDQLTNLEAVNVTMNGKIAGLKEQVVAISGERDFWVSESQRLGQQLGEMEETAARLRFENQQMQGVLDQAPGGSTQQVLQEGLSAGSNMEPASLTMVRATMPAAKPAISGDRPTPRWLYPAIVASLLVFLAVLIALHPAFQVLRGRQVTDNQGVWVRMTPQQAREYVQYARQSAQGRARSGRTHGARG